MVDNGLAISALEQAIEGYTKNEVLEKVGDIPQEYIDKLFLCGDISESYDLIILKRTKYPDGTKDSGNFDIYLPKK
jgi:hypothetical protein